MLHETFNWGDAEDLIAEKGFAVVYFSASWCEPCKKVKPQYARAAVKDAATSYLLIDIDELDDKGVLERFSVMSIPTLVFVAKDGWQKIEARTGEAIVAEVEDIKSNYIL